MIEFRDPPADGRTHWAAVAEACKARPGEWAYIGAFRGAGMGDYARRFGLQTTTRRRDDGARDVYVRWVDEEEK